MAIKTSPAVPNLLDFLSQREAQARETRAPYLALMSSPDTMLFWLSAAAKGARQAAERRQSHIAASGKGRDQSTINRFEDAAAWPRNADDMINAYADDLDIDNIELWAEALRLWRAHREEEGTSAREALTRLSGGPAGQAAVPRARRP